MSIVEPVHADGGFPTKGIRMACVSHGFFSLLILSEEHRAQGGSRESEAGAAGERAAARQSLVSTCSPLLGLVVVGAGCAQRREP